MEDSCMSLHAPGLEPRAKGGWSSSAPLPAIPGSDADGGAPGGGLADALAQHMLLLDMDGDDLCYEDAEAEDAGAAGRGPPSPVPEGGRSGAGSPASGAAAPDGGSAKPKTAPLAPTGFTPAEAYVDRQERTVFFAKCAPSASVDAVARVFGGFGEIEEVNLFRQWPSAKASRGCGLVVMSTSAGASAAIEGLHRRYTWDGVAAPMVVERCCAARLGVKAATQHATRARRTAAAAAARRAARAAGGAGGAWPAGGAPRPGSAPGHHAGLALSPGGAQHYAAAALGPHASLYAAHASAPLPMLPPNAAAAAAAAALAAPHAAALGDPRAANSAPLPAAAYGGYAPAAGGAALYSFCASPHGASPIAASPLTAGLAHGQGHHGGGGGGHLQLDVSGALGAMDVSCLPAPPLHAPDAGAACQVALQSAEQVQLVCSHAATLSALSGAAFWLAPPCPGGPAGALALSGTPGQLQAATELITQLLGAAPPRGPLQGMGLAPAQWQ
ncbi:MAG: hypothetical protein J3K34DRAFT_509611 [Monoraphidium minutum]|nr:MAG: hypothetical protein J3K34DRAFT_509611 [Monoraphidium minutum]